MKVDKEPARINSGEISLGRKVMFIRHRDPVLSQKANACESVLRSLDEEAGERIGC